MTEHGTARIPASRGNPDAAAAPAIAVHGLTVFYEQLQVLDEVSFQARRGEFIAAVGPSGCGKSTLLNVLAGFIAPSSGSVAIEGQDPSSPQLNRGMVFQEYALFPWRTAWRNVAFALESRGVDKAARRTRALELLELVNLSRFADSYPHQLSGGMKQRVAIARALASDPTLLLMDEPLGALDALTRENLMELIDSVWRRTKQTVVYITHNVTEAVYLGDRVLVFTPGPQARIRADLAIDMPRPRHRLSDESVEYQRKITALVTS